MNECTVVTREGTTKVKTSSTVTTVVSEKGNKTVITERVKKTITFEPAELPIPVLQLLSVVSRKTHGAAGIFDRPLDMAAPISGDVTTEPRGNTAPHYIVFEFDAPVTFAGTATAVDSTAAPFGSVSAAADGNTVIVTITGGTDRKRVCVSLEGVNHSTDASVNMGFLIGDIKNVRFCNGAGAATINAISGQPASWLLRAVNGTSGVPYFFYDVDLNGVVQGAGFPNGQDYIDIQVNDGLGAI